MIALSAGNIYVFATSMNGSKKDSCWLNVLEKGTIIPVPATAITIQSGSDVKMHKAESIQLRAVITPAESTEKNIKWGSDQPDIVSVTVDGVITAHKGGSSVITASIETNPAIVASITALVIVDVEAISIGGGSDLELVKDSSLQLQSIISPADASNNNVSWYSTDSDIVTVSQQGIIKGVSEGTAQIIVRSESDPTLKASITVTVIIGANILNCDAIGTLSIFPVPMKDRLYIQAGTIIRSLKIINLEGKTVYYKNGTGSDYLEMDGSDLEAGVYVLKVESTDGKIMDRKIILSR